jgi:hypothetical protein
MHRYLVGEISTVFAAIGEDRMLLSVMNITLQNPHETVWLGRSWSPWIDIYEAVKRYHGPPHQPGLYRLRNADSKEQLLYIGEGKDIRKRLFQLRNAINKAANGATQGPPHWAGACVFQQLQAGASVQVSWLLDTVPYEGERKGIECECIAAHRWVTGANPKCQFVALARRKDL